MHSVAMLLAAVSAVVNDVEMKTYSFSDPDPIPNMLHQAYPYFRFDGGSNVAEPRKWKVLTLDNGRIAVKITPEIGGKVWGAKDLKTGVDFVYDNHVVKFRDIASRGPWVSGGIEFNFGSLGHANSSSTPVDWTYRVNADGSASYFVAMSDYVTRTWWQVEVRLNPDEECFHTYSTMYNSSMLSAPLYHWMNAAFSLRHDARFLFPGCRWSGHGGDVHPWPVNEDGIDVSVYTNNCFGGPKSYHVLPGSGNTYGIWWREKGVGAVHRGLDWEKSGRKVWLWANSREGGIWEDLLTDDDGQYTELQSGLYFIQPCYGNERSVFQNPAFDPASSHEFHETWGVLRDDSLKADNGKSEVVQRPAVVSPDLDENTAVWQYRRGLHFRRFRGVSREAKPYFLKALKFDPAFAPAMNELAAIAMRAGDYGEVHHWARKALAVDTGDIDANYLDGFAYFAEGDNATAKERLGVSAIAGAKNRAAAFALIGRIALRQGRRAEARAAAEKALSANAANLDAMLVRLIALRGEGEFAEYAKELLERYPLFHAVRYELEGPSFARYVTGELPHERYLELGSWYEETGLEKQAQELFALAKDHPVALIRRGLFDSAAKLPVAGVMPFRRETLPALRRAVRECGSWKMKYYLALLLVHFDRADEARTLLGSVVDADEPEFYVVRSRLRQEDLRLRDLLTAKRIGDSWRIGREIGELFEQLEDWPVLYRHMKEYLAKYPDCNHLQRLYALSMVKTGRAAECIAYLKGLKVLPSEHRGSLTAILHEAMRLASPERELEYPENLGRGKPYEGRGGK